MFTSKFRRKFSAIFASLFASAVCLGSHCSYAASPFGNLYDFLDTATAEDFMKGIPQEKKNELNSAFEEADINSSDKFTLIKYDNATCQRKYCSELTGCADCPLTRKETWCAVVNVFPFYYSWHSEYSSVFTRALNAHPVDRNRNYTDFFSSASANKLDPKDFRDFLNEGKLIGYCYQPYDRSDYFRLATIDPNKSNLEITVELTKEDQDKAYVSLKDIHYQITQIEIVKNGQVVATIKGN